MAEEKAKQRAMRGEGKCEWTLVRAVDGKYYLVSKDLQTKPVKTNPGLLKEFLEDLDSQLTVFLREGGDKELRAGSGVHNGTPDIFPQ